MSQARLYRLLGDLVTKPTRKRRSDAGKTALPVQEAQMIAAVLLEHMRKNGKMLKSVEAAVEVLRANNMIEALRISAATGEVSPCRSPPSARPCATIVCTRSNCSRRRRQ